MINLTEVNAINLIIRNAEERGDFVGVELLQKIRDELNRLMSEITRHKGLISNYEKRLKEKSERWNFQQST